MHKKPSLIPRLMSFLEAPISSAVMLALHFAHLLCIDNSATVHSAIVRFDEIATENVLINAQGFALPKVAYLKRLARGAGDAQGIQGEEGVGRVIVKVEHADSDIAVFEVFCPAFNLGDPPMVTCSEGLAICAVLIDGEDFLIGKDLLGSIVHIADITADHQGRAEECPSREMGAVFDIGTACKTYVALTAHTDDKHIHIVEAALTVGGEIFLLLVQELLNRGPAVVDVAGRAPEVRTGLLDPFVGLIVTPRAGGEADIASAVCQSQAHTLVKEVTLLLHRLEAIVVFKIVDTPRSEGFGIDEFVFEGGGVAGTGKVSRAGIHTEFKTLGMDVIGNVFHAVGELYMVGHQAAVFVTLHFCPAVVDNEVFIARVEKSVCDERVCGFHDQCLVDISAKGVPRVPAEGWLAYYHNISAFLMLVLLF